MRKTTEEKKSNPMREERPRGAGILLHITSLPSKYGIGDLGAAAYSFADFLESAGVKLWQILPLGPTGYGNSPYAARSSFAGNELLISPDLLVDEGLLEKSETAQLKQCAQLEKRTQPEKTMSTETPNTDVKRVDFGRIEKNKIPLLKKASRRFAEKIKTDNKEKAAFENFCANEAYWLDDYAVYQVLYEKYYDARWHTVWDKALSKREKKAMDNFKTEKAAEILDCKILQYFFECQWRKLKSYINNKGMKFIGDIPIFASQDSADSWSRIDLFKTDKNKNYTFVSGVPPDYFSATGQLWGNPVYDWKKMKADGYRWWADRIRRLLSQVDLFRIDHFRGFDEYWSIPAGNPTAEHGTWEKCPGADLFRTLEKKLGRLPIIAEDLGFLTDSVIKLRNDLGFPGMKVCQFGFNITEKGALDANHVFLPHNYSYNWAAYSGTHDNNTTAGWYLSLKDEERRITASYLNCPENSTPAEIAWAMIRAVISSHAMYAIFPMQDLLGLGEEARFNLPSTCTGENWSWQLSEIPGAETAKRFAELVNLFGR